MAAPNRISVVIPTLNAPDLPEIVARVRAQAADRVPIEVIVSGLVSPEVVARLDARYVSAGKPLSAGAARNLGVRASAGAYVVFLDSDCFPQPGWLEALLRHASSERRAVSGAVRVVPDHYLRLAGNVASFHEFTTALPPSRRPYLASFCLALPRRAFDEVGWFDETLPRSGGEDLDFTIRLARRGYELWFDPAVAVSHRPARTTLRSFLRHARRAGENSILVRQRYPEAFGMPAWLLRWPILLASSPLLATAAMTRAAFRNRDVRAHWRTLPLVYLSRLGWCIGATRGLRRRPKAPIGGPNNRSVGRAREGST